MTGYIDVAQADAFIEALPAADPERVAWSALTDSDKLAYLFDALTVMEQQVFSGFKTDPEQTLAFPRNGDEDTPEAVQCAQAYEACALCRSSADTSHRASLRAQGVTSFSVGNLSENYGGSASAAQTALCSLRAARLLRTYLAGGVPFAG